MERKKIRTLEKGITLVALVITIVILIVLATVTINFAFGEDGLIEKAQQAKELTEQATRNEQESLNSLMERYNEIISGIGDDETIPDEPTDQTTPIEEVKKGEEFTDTTRIEAPIDSDGSNPDETGIIYVPGGFGIDESSPNDINDGIVISNANDSIQFVWIPVSSEDLAEMYVEAGGTKLTQVATTTDVYSKLRINSNQNTYVAGAPNTMMCREPDINSSLDTISGTANQGIELLKSVFGFTGTDSEVLSSYANMLVDDYMATYKSIKKYGGFYIGRYELTGTTEVPTVQGGARILDEKSYYDLRKACSNVVNSEYAQTTMIYGNQWDEVMDWLVDTGEKTSQEVNVDSSAWSGGEDINFTTATNEKSKANNIYDLAGNAVEWTQEENAIVRGGDLMSLSEFALLEGGASSRFSISDGYTEGEDISLYFQGFPNLSTRPTLYLK